jgi:hypothetical protein
MRSLFRRAHPGLHLAGPPGGRRRRRHHACGRAAHRRRGQRRRRPRVAKAIAHSPLVKTAWAGCDPNWGRLAPPSATPARRSIPTASTSLRRAAHLPRRRPRPEFDEKPPPTPTSPARVLHRHPAAPGLRLLRLLDHRPDPRIHPHQRRLLERDRGTDGAEKRGAREQGSEGAEKQGPRERGSKGAEKRGPPFDSGRPPQRTISAQGRLSDFAQGRLRDQGNTGTRERLWFELCSWNEYEPKGGNNRQTWKDRGYGTSGRRDLGKNDIRKQGRFILAAGIDRGRD